MNTSATSMWPMSSLDWLCAGVDPKYAGNGGPECVNYLGLKQRLIETAIFVALGSLECWFSWQHMDLSSYKVQEKDRTERFGKRFLLVILCMTFGVEIGFKFATKTAIYLLNPCHLLTVVQIYLLAAPPSRLVTVIFRLQMASLSCPLLAILLPVVNTRQLPFEAEVYWIQHFLIYLIIPPYLVSLGGVYKTVRFWDFSWSMLLTGLTNNYHFIVLQSLGMLLQVNLNNIVCPAPSDPFFGATYRVWAFFHQHALFPLHAKVYTYIVQCLVEREPDEGCNGDVVAKNK